VLFFDLNTAYALPKFVFLGITNPRAFAIGTFGE
jgi:hypothetical protein